MDSINEIIAEIHRVSNSLKKLNIRQTSADLAYFVAWWKSQLHNNNNHLPPNPAGENTIDTHSNNCPIPYVKVLNVIHDINVRQSAINIMSDCYSKFVSLKSLTDDNVEITAINAYMSYLYNTVRINGGDIIPDDPTTDAVEIELYLKTDAGVPQQIHFAHNDYWYSIIRNNDDANKVSKLGHEIVSKDPSTCCGFGCLMYQPEEFDYYIVGIYDIDGNPVIDDGNTPNNVTIDHPTNSDMLTIHTNGTPINTDCYTWRIRIVKKSTFVLWTVPNGDVNANVTDKNKWALYNSDGSGSQHTWDSVTYKIINYAYYPNGSTVLKWQGEEAANSYWSATKGDDNNIKVIGNSGISNAIAAIKLQPIGETADVILNVFCTSQEPQAVHFDANLKRYSIIRTKDDYDKLSKFIGVSADTSLHHLERGFSQLIYNPNYDYTIVALYSDDGTTELDSSLIESMQITPLTDVDPSGKYTFPRCAIQALSDIEPHIMSYKVRIHVKEDIAQSIHEYYFTNRGYLEESNTSLDHHGNYLLYDGNGRNTDIMTDKDYTVVHIKDVDGHIITNGGATVKPYGISPYLNSISCENNVAKSAYKLYTLLKEHNGSIEVILNAKCSSKIPIAVNFTSASVYGWSVIRNEIELRKLDAVCGSVYSLDSTMQSYARGYSMLRWNKYFDYTVTALYSDDGITEIKDHSLSYYTVHTYSTAYREAPCVLKSADPIAVNVMAYKVKISLKSEFEYIDVYFTEDGKASTTDKSLTNSYNWPVYDAEGNLVPYNYDKIYGFVTLHKVDGTINNYGSIENFSDTPLTAPKGNLSARADGIKDGYVMKVAVTDKPSVEVVVNLNCLGGVPAAAKFSGSSDYWYAIVRNAEDKAVLNAVCGTVPHKTGSSRELGFGVVKYDSKYTYEVLELYSDNGQTVISELDPKDFHIEDSDSSHNAYIKCSHATTIPAMSYKLKITLK